MPSPHFGNAPVIIGCLEPVRSPEQFRAFKELGGSSTEDQARQDMRKLTSSQLGDLFIVKNGVGAPLTWARITDAGGRGVEVSHGFEQGEMAEKLEKFASDRHQNKRLFAMSWDDERGVPHIDRTRVEAKLRLFAGLNAPAGVGLGAATLGAESKSPGRGGRDL